MFCLNCVIILTSLVINVYGRPENSTHLLTSSYSQVSRWGSGANPPNEARSNAGQTPWTQSSDVRIVRGQNLPPIKKNSNRDSITNKKDLSQGDGGFGKGEVVQIQERFNPRPWFAYEAVNGKGPTYIPPEKTEFKKPQPDFSVPFDSFPLSLKPSDSDKPSPLLKPPYDNTDKPMDYPNKPPTDFQVDDSAISDPPPKNTYGSPFSSYNPNSEKPKAPKKPSNFVTPGYLPPEMEHSNGYLPPEMDKPPKYKSKPQEYLTPEMEHSNGYLPPEMDKPPKYKPKPQPQEYLPPEMDTPPKGHYSSDDDSGPPVSQAMDHPEPLEPPFLGHDHKEHNGYDHPGPSFTSYSNDNDHSGPPKDAPSSPDDSQSFPGLPAYLDHDPHIHGHNLGHYFPYDHHPPIYHEVKTTTEAPENQRLNKKPYSYYYLGRKLWYIPLYFSVYFIIYIFVLILKSIARHKITFNHYFEDDKREMKDMHEEHDEHVHELSDHVYSHLDAARRKYIL